MASSMTDLLQSIEQCESFFRIGVEGAGNDVLVQVLDTLGQELGHRPATDMHSLNPILAEILEAQQVRDWVRVADLLVFELMSWIKDNLSLAARIE